MDIVGRIKYFLNEKNLTVSQFADGCGISRPTVSQLLNGRNKKVSDEIISKIHAAYPALSISWLMFGEGEMMIETSAIEEENAELRENSLFGARFDDGTEYENLVNSSNNNGVATSGFNSVANPQNFPSAINKNLSQCNTTCQAAEPIKVVSAKVEKPLRSVTKIIVYYSDNSFEEFVHK